MVEPEIARRCLSCGASVRQRATFCPQCGQLLGPKQSEAESDYETDAVEGSETQIIVPTAADGFETQIIVPPAAEGSETETIDPPASDPFETQIIVPSSSDGSETQAHPSPTSVAPETQIIASASQIPPIGPEMSDASAMTQADLVLPEDLRSSPAPMVAETQPLIRQTIQREPTVSEADVIASQTGNVPRPGTEHHLMDRVDRIRKVSSVVIDQAAYDPSLRFLLVAALLFILFVVLMVMSKVIG